MTDERYKTPEADLDVPNDSPGSGVKAVMLGVLVDVLGTIFMGFLLAILYGVHLARQGQQADEIMLAMETVDPFSWFGLLGSFLGLLISMGAGYLCARIANHREYRYAAILGVIACLFGLLAGGGYYSMLGNVLVSLLNFGVILLGAYLHVSTKVRA